MSGLSTIQPIVTDSVRAVGVIAIALTVAALAFYGAVFKREAQCLAETMYTSWSLTGHDDPTIAKRQLEAIARVEQANAQKAGASLCHDGSRWRLWNVAKREVINNIDTKRWDLVHSVAWKSVWGVYDHPWPSKWACVNDYKATKLRIMKTIESWFNDAKVVGSIGNMDLICK